MDDSTANLCQRIQETCHQQHWYGPDMYLPTRLQRELSEGETWFWYDRAGQQHPINRRTDTNTLPATWTFEYAPITEAQLQAAEQMLGFSLPPLLRAVYTRVADGGFGPGYGLFHLAHQGENMLDEYLSSRRNARPVDFRIFERRTSDAKRVLIPSYAWPDGFLCLCHWGCAIFSYLDTHTGRVFRAEYYGEEQESFDAEAPSLEAWFVRWQQTGIAMFAL